LLGKATLIINAADVDVSSEEDRRECSRVEALALRHKLLVGGVWCIADLEYMFTEDKNASPWLLASIKPIQLSHFDFDAYLAARKQFSTEEWIDLLIQSVGFNPQMFSRNKLSQLVRLIPFCERNFNLIELGPKGTGKSHIFSSFHRTAF
jgi:ATP-dependent Lon protease